MQNYVNFEINKKLFVLSNYLFAGWYLLGERMGWAWDNGVWLLWFL